MISLGCSHNCIGKWNSVPSVAWPPSRCAARLCQALTRLPDGSSCPLVPITVTAKQRFPQLWLNLNTEII